MKLSAPPSLNAFLKRKNIEFSFSRYALKAMSAMAQEALLRSMWLQYWPLKLERP